MSKFKLVLVTALISMLVAVPTAVVASHQFRDVPSDNVHHDAISWLASVGVTGGCSADGTSYCPEDPVTRAQMATFLKRFADNVATSEQATTVPAGAILMMPAGQACPSGYTGVPSLDGRFPRGATASGTGGSTSHSHAHPHSHSISLETDTGFDSWGGGFGAPQYVEDSSGSFHTHNVTGTTGGVSSFETETQSGDHLPPYYNVRFCSKN